MGYVEVLPRLLRDVRRLQMGLIDLIRNKFVTDARCVKKPGCVGFLDHEAGLERTSAAEAAAAAHAGNAHSAHTLAHLLTGLAEVAETPGEG